MNRASRLKDCQEFLQDWSPDENQEIWEELVANFREGILNIARTESIASYSLLLSENKIFRNILLDRLVENAFGISNIDIFNISVLVADDGTERRTISCLSSQLRAELAEYVHREAKELRDQRREEATFEVKVESIGTEVDLVQELVSHFLISACCLSFRHQDTVSVPVLFLAFRYWASTEGINAPQLPYTVFLDSLSTAPRVKGHMFNQCVVGITLKLPGLEDLRIESPVSIELPEIKEKHPKAREEFLTRKRTRRNKYGNLGY